MKITLYDIAHARSGDKGGNANVGLIFRSKGIYHWAKDHITSKRVKDHFGHIVKGKVIRYELPNLLAFNFILEDSLGGGGSETLQIDAQGKTYGQRLLMMEVDLPDELYNV
ncbi:MAG: hypothetical protein IID16_03445 [Candidatus Marinimicrobia bacterium]|nr:hypothetical protein [Candidatus Neomarinimicrobiota bacterium]